MITKVPPADADYIRERVRSGMRSWAIGQALAAPTMQMFCEGGFSDEYIFDEWRYENANRAAVRAGQ